LPELFTFDLEQLGENPQQALEQSRLLEQAVVKLCKKLGIYVALSLLTEDEGLRHSGILIDDQGQRIACYHQTHLRHSYKSWCKAGDSLPVWDTPLGRIGFMLGYDALFPEVAAVLARKGAEVILHPTQWQFNWELKYILPERAAENRVSILSATRADSVIKRGGMICAMSASLPLGARDLNPIWPVESPGDRESYIQYTIDPSRSRNKDLLGFDLQADRRPELYGKLVESLK
jgi:predicted amidohydrolase